ncbi:hypothetical protein RJ640_008180, partial [Escallonia rubra]
MKEWEKKTELFEVFTKNSMAASTVVDSGVDSWIASVLYWKTVVDSGVLDYSPSRVNFYNHSTLLRFPLQKQVFLAMAECVAASTPANDFPVIDLSRTIAAVVAEIGDACEKWGAFQVVNHGVPLELHAKFELAMKKFFAQPTEEKRKLRKDIGGVTPYDYGYEEFAKNLISINREACEEYGQEMEKLSF